MIRISTVVFTLIAQLGGMTLLAREWRDVTGKYRVEAEFVKVANNQVELMRPDGLTIQVPLDRLSAADRKYIADRAQSSPAATAARSKPGTKSTGADKQFPLKLTNPTLLKNTKGDQYGIIARVTTSNGQPIPENSLLAALILFDGAVEDELTDLAPVPRSFDTGQIISSPDPRLMHLNTSYQVASKKAGVRGKAKGLGGGNYEPGADETVLFMGMHESTFKKFGALPDQGGTWGFYLTDPRFRPVSNVVVFTQDDLQTADHLSKAWADRVKQLAAESEGQ